MKVGILTYHDGPNHGAFLQAWATYQTLLTAGFDAEIINYKNPNHSRKEGRFSLLRQRNPIFAWRMWQKQRAFSNAKKNFNLGPLITTNKDLLSHYYDAVVIGSDVVWNYKIFGYDPAYFGRLNAKRRISFSASFGTVSIEDKHPIDLARDLASLTSISVRDVNSQNIISKVLNRSSEITLDPTLIYDFELEQQRFKQDNSQSKLVVYSYRQNTESVTYALDSAKRNGLKIVCLGYPPPVRYSSYCDHIDMRCEPFQWVKHFHSAHSIITSTFHGVVFSLKAQKPFVFVTGRSTYNRVTSLLNFCQIDHDIKEQSEGEIHHFNPDYSKVNVILRTAAKHSRAWLLDQLEL